MLKINEVNGTLIASCSRHMIGDQNKFISQNEEKEGSITFGDNAYAKIVGKSIVSLGNE